jgi:hypothetical protein
MSTTFNDRAASICNRRGLSYDASQEIMAEANKADELVAALEAVCALENTEANEWDAVEVVIPKMVAIARAALDKVK